MELNSVTLYSIVTWVVVLALNARVANTVPLRKSLRSVEDGKASAMMVGRHRVARNSLLRGSPAKILPQHPDALTKTDMNVYPMVTVRQAQEPGDSSSSSFHPNSGLTTNVPGGATRQSSNTNGDGDARQGSSTPVSSSDNAAHPVNASSSTTGRKRHDLPCTRYTRNRTLRMANCAEQIVDVGYCVGLCASRERPGEEQVTDADGVYRFPAVSKCSCCRATYEKVTVNMQCLSSDSGFHISPVPVQVSVVKRCQCVSSRCTEKRA